MAGDWDKAKAAAEKILGKDAEVPDLPDTINTALDKFQGAREAFVKACADLDKACLDLDNANSALKNAVTQFKGKVDKSDFGLDGKSKDDTKKIQQAHKILMAELSAGAKSTAANEKKIEGLDKTVNELGKVSSGWKRMNPMLGFKVEI